MAGLYLVFNSDSGVLYPDSTLLSVLRIVIFCTGWLHSLSLPHGGSTSTIRQTKDILKQWEKVEVLNNVADVEHTQIQTTIQSSSTYKLRHSTVFSPHHKYEYNGCRCGMAFQLEREKINSH